MIAALLATLAAVCFTGWLLTTDAFWGTVTMEIVHETLTNIALVLVAVACRGGGGREHPAPREPRALDADRG